MTEQDKECCREEIAKDGWHKVGQIEPEPDVLLWNTDKKVGTTGQYVNRIIKKKDGLVNKTFVDMMEALGYDITITYTPRK